MALTTRQHSADRCGHNDAMKTWVKWAIAAAVVIVVALVAGPFVYINFIKDDAPERFALDDAGIDHGRHGRRVDHRPHRDRRADRGTDRGDGHRPDRRVVVMVPTGCG